MNRFLISLIVGAALAVCPNTVQAKKRQPDPDEARQLVLEYARCIVKGEHERASKVLLTNADNSTILREFRRVIDGDCLRSDVDSVEFSADLYRYALADALVAAEFADGGPSDFSDRAPLVHLPVPAPADREAALANAKSAKDRDKVLKIIQGAQTVAALSQYGECVVRHDPTNSRLWTLTKPGSPSETDRINDLRRAFGACLKSGQVSFSAETLRGTVALNYYRLAHAPVQPAAGEVN